MRGKWNRSNPERREAPVGRVSSRMWLAFVVPLVAIAAAAVVLLCRKADRASGVASAADGAARLIKEAKPVVAKAAKAATNVVVDARRAKELSRTGNRGYPMVVTDTDGQEWFNGAIVPKMSAGEGIVDGRPASILRNLDSRAERIVASLFLMNAGDKSVAPAGAVRYGPEFNEEFMQALLSPTQIKDDDTPKIAAFKEDTRAAMKEVQARIRNGEDLCDILNEQFRLTQKVAGIRENYTQMIREAEQSGAALEDIALTYEAANKLLDKYGARHIEMDIKKRRALQELQEKSKGKETENEH